MYVRTKALQILHHGVIHFAEVRFYFFKMFGEDLQAFALVSLYSPPNEYLLQTTSDTLVVCRYQGDGALTVIHWGRGPMETGVYMLGTFQALSQSSSNVQTRYISFTFEM